MRVFCIVTWCWLVAIGPFCTAEAQGALQDHQYSTSDIEQGSRLYATQCSLCHGPNGEGATGPELRRGQFRRSVSDEDLSRVILNGVTGSGMPGFQLQPAEVYTLVAFIRAGFDASG